MSTITLIDHLKELRKRLFFSAFSIGIGSVVAFLVFDKAILWLASPFETISTTLAGHQLYVTSLLEGFTTKIKFSFLFGIVLSFPILLYQSLRFILPGLTKKEKRLVIVALIVSMLLAGLSFYMTYFKLLPFSVQFLTSIQFIPKEVGVLLGYKQNIFYVFNLIFYSMIVFQFPILLEVMLYLNIVSRKTLWGLSRYVIVFIFIGSAIITPPDIITQIGLSVPLIGLYFLTIIIAKLFKLGES